MGIFENRNMCKKIIEKGIKNSIILSIKGSDADMYKKSHIGGNPDVPFDFEWPVYADENFDFEPYPLTFIAQLNCEELSKFDKENLLPHKGMLSFFYEFENQPYGLEKGDAGSARVFWFEEIESLRTMEAPNELDYVDRWQCSSVECICEDCFPGWEDYSMCFGELSGEDIRYYCNELEALGYVCCNDRTKVLGWPDVIQRSMIETCERMVSDNEEQEMMDSCFDKWQLLFQLHSPNYDDMMFGDCGTLYFYIRKEDLKQRNFDDVWCVLQD